MSLLFADAATGAHSPALVSQGKIGAVIAAKPVERRQLLEEAAGISGLHARRKDAEQKLRATEANLARLGEILGDQEQRAAQLRRQARAAERYRKLTDQIRGVEGAAAPCALARSGARRGSRDGGSRARRPRRSSGSSQAIAEAQAAHERANAALNEQAQRARASCASRATSWRTSSRRRGRGGTRSRGGWPSSSGSMPRSPADIQREEALKGDAARAIASLEAERAAIARRLEDAEAHSARIATELSTAEATSREAEAALAELLARQAAMRAERRVAEAALEAAKAQLAGRSRSGRSSPSSYRRWAMAANSGARAREAEAQGRSGTRGPGSEPKRGESRPSRAARPRPRQRDAAESQLASARAALSAARSEHDALARALEHGGGAAIASLQRRAGL